MTLVKLVVAGTDLACQCCGRNFQSKKSWEVPPKYCSDACKQRAYRIRHRDSAPVTASEARVTASKAR